MEEKIKVNWREFQEQYRSAIPEDLANAVLRMALDGKDIEYIEISKADYDATLATKRDREVEQQEYQDVSRLRLAGMAAEQAGDLNEARKQYTLCINYGEHVATHKMFSAYAHAYKRLIIILHKLNEYSEEQHYIESFLRYGDRLTTAEYDTYTKRLEGVKKKTKQ